MALVNTEHGVRPKLKYLRGGKCPADAASELSSEIEFYCDVKAGKVSRIALVLHQMGIIFHSHTSFPPKGEPVLQEIVDDCHYAFKWATNVICPQRDIQFKANSCEIYNDEMNATLDLRSVFKDGIVNVSDFV